MTRFEKSIYFFLAALVWVYVLFRIIYIPALNDEIFTFFHYLLPGEFMPFQSVPDANNHFLNTFLGYVTYKLLGVNIYYFRAINIIALLVYLYFTYKLALLENNLFGRWAIIVFCLFTHTIIEWFGYYRGYGLMFSFFLASIYFLVLYFKKREFNYYWKLNIFLLLALLSNMSVISYVGICVALTTIYTVINFRTRKNLMVMSFFLILWTAAFVFYAKYFFYLSSHGSLYLGETSGFFSGTLANLSLWIFPVSVYKIFWALISGLIGLLFIILFIHIIKKRTIFLQENVVGLVMVLTILSYYVLNKLFGSLFPVNRTAEHVLVLLILSIIYEARFWSGIFKRKYIYYLSVSTVFLIPIFSLAKVMPIQYSLDNKFRIKENFYEIIEENSTSLSTISGPDYTRLNYAWYKFVNKGKSNIPQSSDYPSKVCDYIILDNSESLKNYLDEYNIKDSFPRNDMYLLEREQVYSKRLYKPLSVNLLDEFIENEYISLADDWHIKDTLPKNLIFNYELSLNLLDGVTGSWIVITMYDEMDNVLKYEALPLDYLLRKQAKNYYLNNSIYISDISPDTKKVVTYIWNIKKRKISITGSDIDIYQLN